MTPMNCGCPTCKTVLQIAQALPARVQCPKCQTVFTVAAPPGAQPAAGVRPGASPARGPGGSTAVRSAPAAAEPLLMPRNRPKRGPSRQSKKGGGGGALIAIVVVSLLLLLVGGGAAAFFLLGGGGPAKTDDKTPETTDPKNKKPTLSVLSERDIKIQAAIDRGVESLRNQLLKGEKKFYNPDLPIGPDQPQPGSDVGVSALGGLTLLECGVSLTDPAVQKVYDYVHATEKRLTFTYSLALSVMFLDRLHQARKEQLDPLKLSPDKNKDAIRKIEEQQAKDVSVIHRVSVRILAAQHVKGGWGYVCPVLKLTEEDALLEVFKKGTPFTPRVEPASRYDREDSSINQFVTLALWTARRHQIKTESALLRIDQRYRNIQSEDGGWGYTEGSPTLKDATTCAGLIALAVGQAVKTDVEQDKQDKGKKKAVNLLKEDPNISKGMKFLGQAVGRTKSISATIRETRHQETEEMLKYIKQLLETKDPDQRNAIARKLGKLEDPPAKLRGTYFAADAWGDLYFLWSVERVAVVYDLKKIGEKDWFAWGSELILKNQLPDGSWQDRFPGIPDTCFALLFLKRANVVKDLTNKLRGLTGGTTVAANPRPTPTPPAPERKKE